MVGSNQLRPIRSLFLSLVFVIIGGPLPASIEAINSDSPDGIWRFAEERKSITSSTAGPRSYRAVKVSRSSLETVLRSAPSESDPLAKNHPAVLALPTPDGRFLRFSVVESPVLAPELAARFPEIKTYMGQGIDEPGATTRLDWMPTGFHAIVLSKDGTILIEPKNANDPENHIVYFQHDVAGASFKCDVTGGEQEMAMTRRSPNTPAVISGTTLKTYRLAAAATAEYTQTYGGGTVGGALSAITTTVNLVNAIYEREVAIRLMLVANETAILFTNSATDGYTSDNVGALLSQNQTKLDSVIGAANYDIGHVFDGRTMGGGAFSWQGRASIGCVCANGLKGRGVDIFRSVPPTSVFAYYSAAHEIGHQFGATHTFNATTGPCGSERSPSTAYEPVNGSTIMAYRYACAPEDLMSMDTYFHNRSLEQIVDFTTTGSESGCGVPSATGNHPPTVGAGLAHIIPSRTPFVLTATASDADGNPLTFAWEEFDLGTAAPPDTDDGSRPIFRSFAPVSSRARIFPRLQDVLARTATFGESMPTTTRTMNFRVTARDNRAGGGGIASAATHVSVTSAAGPFTVTQPSTGTNWAGGRFHTVTWNVANTNRSPINCANVRITLSTNGGSSFPTILANSTPNDGAETLAIPNSVSSNARIKVEGINNIFFNISQSFAISSTGPASLGNVSSRAPVQAGANVLIGGFIISGTQNKRVLLRALGPSLTLAGKLMNPILELYNANQVLIDSNDNWGNATNHQEIANTGSAPVNPLESAILRSLTPGAYTAIVRGVSNTTGIALVEAYDLDTAGSSKFANISARARVQTGDNVLIGGFIVLGNLQKVVIRAIGPSLPIAGRLGNPTLELHNAQGTLLTSNDDWRTTQQSEIIATGLAPSNNFESAIVRTLAPGGYTAIVRGKNNTGGVALAEVYAIN
jgi:hypothetical protein